MPMSRSPGARFADVDPGLHYIPGALKNVAAGGVTWAPRQRGPLAALRIRHFGSYPLIEDNSVRAVSTTLLNANGGVLISSVRLQVRILNLLNARANDIQYYYPSRVSGEPAGGAEDIHFHPVEPRQVRAVLRWEF